MNLLLPGQLDCFNPPEPKTILTKSGQLTYATIGEGPAILLFHGTGSSFFAEMALEFPLVEAGYKLIVPHRLGYLGTPLNHYRNSSDYAVSVNELLDQLEIETVVVVGTSGGGPAAVQFAKHYQSRTQSLILQCAVTHPWIHRRWEPQSKQFKIRFIRKEWSRRVINWCALKVPPRLLIPQNSRSLEPLVGSRWSALKNLTIVPAIEQIFHINRSNWHSAQGLFNDLEVFFGPSWLDQDSYSGPTLIIHDELDTVVPFDHALHAKALLPGAELYSVEAGGHIIWIGNDAMKMHSRRLDFISEHQ